MPRFDRSGPNGVGPLTGRGSGPCGDGVPKRRAFMNRGYGRGWGFGRGFGRGLFQGYAESNIDEKTYLQNRIELVEEELKQLKELQGKTE